MRSFWPSGPVKRPYKQAAQNRADVPFKNVTGLFVFPRLLNQPAERSLMLIDLFRRGVLRQRRQGAVEFAVQLDVLGDLFLKVRDGLGIGIDPLLVGLGNRGWRSSEGRWR